MWHVHIFHMIRTFRFKPVQIVFDEINLIICKIDSETDSKQKKRWILSACVPVLDYVSCKSF